MTRAPLGVVFAAMLCAVCAHGQAPRPEQPIALHLDGLAAPLAKALREALASASEEAAAAANDRERAQAWGHLGMFYQAQHLPWAAEQAYNLALAEDDAPRWRYLRATVLEERGRLERAVADYRRVTATAPDNIAAWYRLGAGLLLDGDDVGAERAFDEALKRDSELTVAMVGKAEVRMRRRQWRSARDWLQRAWDLAPNSGHVAYKLALAHRALGDAEGARRWLERRGASAEPTIDDPLLLEVARQSLSARFFVKAGEWAFERGEVREALTSLANAVALAPDSADIRLTYARLLVLAGRPASALREVRHVTIHHPASAGGWYELAWLLRHREAEAEMAEAEAAVRRSLALREGVRARILAAAFAMRQGRFARAAQDYAIAAPAAPEQADVRYWLGLARLANGDCAGRTQLHTALELRPSWGEAHLALARGDALCGEAGAALRRARGLLRRRDDVDTRLTLAFAKLAAGDRDAVSALVAADATHPDAALLDDALKRGRLPQRPFAAESTWWMPPEVRPRHNSPLP